MSALLEVRDLRVAYGRIEAVKGISLVVEAGQIVTLIGSNGAGKTTTLRSLSGLHAALAGSVYFDGHRIDRLPAHTLVEKGIAHSPEGRHIFPQMTVEENLELGAFIRGRDRGLRADIDGVYDRFRGWANAETRRPARCPAGSSRCWPWAEP